MYDEYKKLRLIGKYIISVKVTNKRIVVYVKSKKKNICKNKLKIKTRK